MIIEAALLAALTITDIEWRNGGDYAERFTNPGSPFVSTLTRQLGAVTGVAYDAAGRARDIENGKALDPPRVRPECVAMVPDVDATVTAQSRRRATAPEREVIDLMELYTFAAENGAGGRAPMESKIAAAVDL